MKRYEVPVYLLLSLLIFSLRTGLYRDGDLWGVVLFFSGPAGIPPFLSSNYQRASDPVVLETGELIAIVLVWLAPMIALLRVKIWSMFISSASVVLWLTVGAVIYAGIVIGSA